MHTMMWHMTRFDLRQIVRDRMFVATLLAMPVLSMLLVRVFLPMLAQQYPVLAGFERLAVVFLAFQAGILSGFIVSFMMLEEKDANTLRALFVTRLSRRDFVVYRVTLLMGMSMLLSLAIILLCGVAMEALTMLTLAMMSALVALDLALVMVLLAHNKVEGLTWFKGFNFVLFVPVIPVAMDLTWSQYLAVIPSWWLFEVGTATEFNDAKALLGVVYMLLLAGVLGRRVLRAL
jgi:hypothetical protein